MKDGGSIILTGSIADIERFSRHECVQRYESGRSFICPDLDK